MAGKMVEKIKSNQAWTCIILFFRLLIPLVLLVCGVIIFVAQISVLNLILGLPLIVVGVVLVIYTYDEIVRIRIGDIPPRDIDEEQEY